MMLKRTCVAVALAVLAGCQVTPPAQPPEPTSVLQLIASEPLVLAPGCDMTGSVFVEFTVRRDGSTDALKLPSTPACVREALTAWVGSFRYRPPPAEIPSSVEWLMVSARRGS